jgi:tetratricopeptide (TPR) repeat protein
MSAGRTADAAGYLDRAVKIAPADLDILYHRGRAHLRLSQESYREMFKLDPKSARVHQVLAQSYEEAGRDAEAIAEYELTAKLAPNMPGVHEALGSLYWKNSKLDEAEAALEQEMKIDPHSALARYKLGSIRVERGKVEAGLPLLEAAVRQGPDLLDAYYYLGKGQALQGQHDQAITNFKKLIEGDPSGELTVSAYYQLAQVYRKQGRQAEARAALETYQKLKDERERQRGEKLEELKRRVP